MIEDKLEKEYRDAWADADADMATHAVAIAAYDRWQAELNKSKKPKTFKHTLYIYKGFTDEYLVTSAKLTPMEGNPLLATQEVDVTDPQPKSDELISLEKQAQDIQDRINIIKGEL